MKYYGEIFVRREKFNEMERACREKIAADYRRDEVLFDETFRFSNGNFMAIQVCVPDCKDESCWTQGVLFNKKGFEISCTDVGDSFQDEYTVFDGDDVYTVNVKPSVT